jgi:hypothetical protein
MSWPPSWFLYIVGLVLRWILRGCVSVSYSWVTTVSNMLRFDFVFEALGVWIFLGNRDYKLLVFVGRLGLGV